MMSSESLYIDRLLRVLGDVGDGQVVRCDGRAVSGNQLRARIFQYARALSDRNVGRGSLLGLFVPNLPDALAVRYAAHVLGAATVFLSVPPTLEGQRELLGHLAPDLLVVFPQTLALAEAAGGIPWVTIGCGARSACNALDHALDLRDPAPLPVQAQINDLAVIASSGGTTGVPKGSCRTFSVYTRMVTRPGSQARIQLVNGPFAYLSQVLVDVTLLGGGCVVLQDGYDPARTLGAIERERVTDLFLVEPQLFDLMDHPGIGSHDLSSLRSLMHIGATAPSVLRMRARDRFGPVISHVYGASEIGLVSMLAPEEHDPSHPESFASAGHLLPEVNVRFRRADGLLAGPGGTGIVEVRSPAMASGYRNDQNLTARNFHDGWYTTGDLGRLEADGSLRIFGRATDAIDVGGRLVGSVEIEDVVCRQPTIRGAVAFRDPAGGVMIIGVVGWEGRPGKLDVCRRALNDLLGRAIAASCVITALPGIPRTPQGKPDRLAIAGLAHLAASG